MATVQFFPNPPLDEIKHILSNEFHIPNPDPLGVWQQMQLGIHRWLQSKDQGFLSGIWNGERRDDQVLGTVIGVTGFKS